MPQILQYDAAVDEYVPAEQVVLSDEPVLFT
jgi:hypothetical protein